MRLLDGVGETEGARRRGVPLGLGVGDHPGVHLLELVGLPADRLAQVRGRVPDAAERPQVGVRVDGLGQRGGAEEPRDGRVTLLVGLRREGEVLPVGLRFAGEGVLEMLSVLPMSDPPGVWLTAIMPPSGEPKLRS